MEENVYRTGPTEPPANHKGIVTAITVALIILVSLAVVLSALSQSSSRVRTVAILSPGAATAPAERSALGFSWDEVTEIDRRLENKPAGVNVLSVEEGSQAQARGIRPGDVLTALNGEAIDGESLERRLQNRIPGAPMDLLLFRSGTYFTVTIKPEN